MFLAAGGACAECGEPLSRGWHADHRKPWIRGGATDIRNGQALCAVCNLRKGDDEPEDSFLD